MNFLIAWIVVFLLSLIVFIAFYIYGKKESNKKYLSLFIMIDAFSLVVFGTLVLFHYTSDETKREHFNAGGLLQCIGRVDNYLVSNKEYILRDDYLIKEERAVSLDRCTRIE